MVWLDLREVGIMINLNHIIRVDPDHVLVDGEGTLDIRQRVCSFEGLFIDMKDVREGHVDDIAESDGDPFCVNIARVGAGAAVFRMVILKEGCDNILGVLPQFVQLGCFLELFFRRSFEGMLDNLIVRVCFVYQHIVATVGE